MRLRKVFALLLVMIAVPAFIFASGAAEEAEDVSLQHVQEAGKFVLGLDDSFPPMGYRNDDGDIVGFDIDTAREVCARLGVELVCQPIDWAAKEQELASGNIDCIWNGFTKSYEREKVMIFSKPYARNAQVAVVRGDSKVEKLREMEGLVIGLQAGSTAQEAVDALPEFKSILKDEITFKDNLMALMDLEAGGVDAVVLDLIVAEYNIRQSGKDFRILNETLTDEEYAIGFRKDAVALRDAVDAALHEMAVDGTLAEISTKWFGSDISVVR